MIEVDNNLCLHSNMAYLLQNKASSEYYIRGAIPKYQRVKGLKIKKGMRVIHQPTPELKELQASVIRELKRYKVGIHNAAYAYCPNRDIKSMAARHVGKNRVIRIDLEDFFPSITYGMVNTALPPEVPKNLRSVIKNWCFLDGGLPQGAPSSPFLSNVAVFLLDVKMEKLCKEWRHALLDGPHKTRIDARFWRLEPITYTRYSDDLIFSSNYIHLNSLIYDIRRAIKSSSLKVNEKKICTAKNKGNRQYVTGVVVNEKLSTPRDSRSRVRSDLHRIIMDTASGKCPPLHKLKINGDVVPINEENTFFPFAKLEGLVSHITRINQSQGVKLQGLCRILRDVHLKPQEEWASETLAYVNKCLSS